MLKAKCRATSLAKACGLLAISLTIQACGGGGSADEPSGPVFDIQAAMTHHYATAKTLTYTGSVNAEGKTSAATVAVTTTPASQAAVFPISGKSYPYAQRSSTFKVAGQTVQTIEEKLFFDPASNLEQGQASDDGRSCSLVLVQKPWPSKAKLGDSGKGSSGVEYANCQSGELIEATFAESWAVKQEGARVLFCIITTRKSVASSAISSETQCFQLEAGGRLGNFSSWVIQDAKSSKELRTL